MQGLILAAGYGTRLGDITKDKPKALVKVQGKPVIDYVIKKMMDSGISRIMVNVHYKAHMIRDYLKDGFDYSYEPVLLGEANTLINLSRYLKDEPTVIMNADTITDIDLNEMYKDMISGYSSIASYQGEVFTGTKLINMDDTYSTLSLVDYKCNWIDIGTPQNLQKAQKLKWVQKI